MKMRKIMTVLCAVVLIIGCCVLTAVADDANVTYSGNSGKLIFEPGSKYSPTDLFDNFKGVMPGASITQKIEVKNNADDNVKVKIYLRSLGSTNKIFNRFLDQLTLTVTADGGSPLFRAEADKTAGLTDWVCLGTLYSGGSVMLDVTLDVPTSLDNRYQHRIGKIKWQFVTEEFPLEKPKWKCPKNSKHPYHIEVRDGIAVFVCNKCGRTAAVKCRECGGTMHEVIVVTIGGGTYTAYYSGDNHYKTKDGNVDFYLNADKIIEYYTLNGNRIDVKSVHEYVLYNYYECVGDGEVDDDEDADEKEHHHTDPIPVKTSDETQLGLWIGVMATATILLIILILVKRRKSEDEEERERC